MILTDMLAEAREHTIRGSFSFLAAASFLYVAAENAEYALRERRYERLFVAFCAAAFAVWEAFKVGSRVEKVLNFRE